MDVDLSLAWLPFEADAIRAARFVPLGKLKVPVPCPEGLIIYKVVAWRPQDRLDVER